MKLLVMLDYDLPEEETDFVPELARAFSELDPQYIPEAAHLATDEVRAVLLAVLENAGKE